MAPIKFEDQLKEKLEKRHIQPSSDAWNKLSDKLDEVDDSANNKGFWWLGIAATIIGVLLAVTFILKPDVENIEPIMVDVENENAIEKQEVPKLILHQENNQEPNTVVVEANEKPKIETKQKEQKNTIIQTPLQSTIKEKGKALISKKVDDVVAKVDNNLNIENSNNKLIETNIELLSFEDQKVNEVVAQLKKMEQENKEVSDIEIEKLLETAQREVTMQKLYNEATKTVDAEALLQSVEDDLDLSFRDKVFSAIQEGYKTVKTAVAERNN